jgi:hypothetical protein
MAVGTVGTFLALSACGTSGVSPVGTYTAIFDYSQPSTAPTLFPLTLSADGHFVLTVGSHSIKGTWSEANGSVTLDGSVTTAEFVGPQKFVLEVPQSGENLGSASRPGDLKGGGPFSLTEGFGPHPLGHVRVPWYAVRK